MKVESSIKESIISSTTAPITDINEIIKVICQWNGISLDTFSSIVGHYTELGKDESGKPIYVKDNVIINPIGVYLKYVYENKEIVFEKNNDKFFGVMQIRSSNAMRYQLGDQIIEIPFEIRAVNKDTGEFITIFPKSSDILQSWMKNLYVVNNGWAERQRIEKEIMAKMIELAQVKGGNEIISTQSVVEELQTALKKRGIEFRIDGQNIYLDIPWRRVRDTAGKDKEYLAPPIVIDINLDNKSIGCKGYSSHGFGSPTSYGSPCWGNWDNDVGKCLRECSIKELINLMISWAYGYNSDDTGSYRSGSGRHPLNKLQDYVYWAYDRKDDDYNETAKKMIQEIKEHLAEIKPELEIENWLDGCSGLKEYLSSLEGNNETSEQG